MVVILSEKDMLPPPPPYQSSSSLEPISPPPFPGRREVVKLPSLPPHILLYIVHQTLPQTDGQYGGEGKVERQRKVLYWMTVSLRLVNRSLYIGMYIDIERYFVDSNIRNAVCQLVCTYCDRHIYPHTPP